MDSELTTHIAAAEKIKSSGRWGAINQKIRQLAANHNGHEAWQIQVLGALSFKNFSEYLALKKAYEDSGSESSLLAWRARNLLEISVWSIYCAQSKENTRAFYEDAGRDVVGIYDAFTKWGKITSQGNDWLNSIANAKQDISTRAASEGIESLEGSYKQVRDAASACGFGGHFNVDYKLLSKFAHPTAMLIMGAPDPEKEKLQKDMFYNDGCMFFVGAFTALEGVLSVLVEHPA
ncbi:MAG: hypothetical protein FJ311_01960 [Rhodospirillales bacterium]|nr:hypothetical protein [Rhodospirillales bacterium]